MRIPSYEEQSIDAPYVQNNNPDAGPQAPVPVQAAQSAQEQAVAAARNEAWQQDETTTATAAYIAFEEALQQDLYGPQGLLTMEGHSALGAPQVLQELVQQRAAEKVTQAGTRLGQGIFIAQVNRLEARLLPLAEEHAAKQRQQWQMQTFSARSALAVDTAVRHYDKPDLYNAALAEALQAATLAGKAAGLAPEAIARIRTTLVSRAFVGMAQKYVQDGNGDAALSIAQSGKMLEEDAENVRQLVQCAQRAQEILTPLREYEARRKAARQWEDSLYQSLMVGDYDAALQCALAAPKGPRNSLHPEQALKHNTEQGAAAPADYTQQALRLIEHYMRGQQERTDANLLWQWQQSLLDAPADFARQWNSVEHLLTMERSIREALTKAADTLAHPGPEAQAFHANIVAESRILAQAYAGMGITNPRQAKPGEIALMLEFNRCFEEEVEKFNAEKERAPTLVEKKQLCDAVLSCVNLGT